MEDKFIQSTKVQDAAAKADAAGTVAILQLVYFTGGRDWEIWLVIDGKNELRNVHNLQEGTAKDRFMALQQLFLDRGITYEARVSYPNN